MKCGCVALANDANDKSVCPVHVGTNQDADARAVDQNAPDLSERTARCPYCKSQRPSDYSLPFFELARPLSEDMDSFYCGCRGWE
jgi:hypothetical protein